MSIAVVGALATAGDAAAQTSPCTTLAFEWNAAAALQSCTALLETDLAPAARAHAYKIRARAFKRLGQLDPAISDFEAALKLAPADTELHILRGWANYDKHENELALARAAHVLTLDPNLGDAYDLAGTVMLRLHDYARARKNYDVAIRLAPNLPLIRLHRHQLFDRLGQLAEALAELDAILALPVADITRGANLEFYGRYVTFRTLARLKRALTLIALDRRSEADTVYDQLVADDADAVALTNRAAHHRHYQSRPEDQVQADLDKAIALDPNYWAPHDVRGRLYFYSKRYEAAAKAFAQASRLAPKRGDVRWWHSMALRKLDRIDEATVVAVSVIEADPGYLMNGKLSVLEERGYFRLPKKRDDLLPALRDAIQACMHDERCW